MRIYAQQTIPERDYLEAKRDSEYAAHIERNVKNALSLSIARFIEPYIQVETLKEGEFSETKRVELFVLSIKQANQIAEILRSFTTYDGDYMSIPVEDRVQLIRSIFLSNTLE